MKLTMPKFFIQLDEHHVGSSTMKTCLKEGMLVLINVLTLDFENDFTSGNFTRINSIIDSPVRMIQSGAPVKAI